MKSKYHIFVIAAVLFAVLHCINVTFAGLARSGEVPDPDAAYYFDWGFQRDGKLFAIVREYIGYDDAHGKSEYTEQKVIVLDSDDVNFDCKRLGLWGICNSENHSFMDFHGYYYSQEGLHSEGGRYSSPADSSINQWGIFVYKLFISRQKILLEQGIEIVTDNIYTTYDAAMCLPKMVLPTGEIINCKR